ncbi:unnamed protein product, partial [Laminaria digitata]
MSSPLLYVQDLVHTHDKFVGPVPADLDEGTKALHAMFPLLIDNKVAMASATAAGLLFPKTTLGEGHQWLRTTFPQQQQQQQPEVTEAAVGAPQPHSTNGTDGDGDKVLSPPGIGDGGGDELEVVVVGEGGDGEKSGGDAGTEAVAAAAAAAAATEAEAAELKRRAWDATFAPGFEERYAEGGQEHEAGFDAYLTGCCFAAAATLGLGVGVEELKGMATGGEVPEALQAVSNVVPLFKILGGQRLCLSGPAPPLDLRCYVHVSGFPSAARTDAVMRPLKAVDGCASVWFHWIDDTSGVAELPSEDGAKALLEAAGSAAAAAAAAAGAVVGAAAEGVVDPTQLVLADMKLVQLNSALLHSHDGQKEGEEEEEEEKEEEAKGEK